jgi:hypothetical protein
VNKQVGSRMCAATTTSGRPCPLKVVRGSAAHCYQHAPEFAEERHLARVRGGREATARRVLAASTQPPAVDTVEAVRDLLSETIQQVRTGQLAPNVGSVVISGINSALKVVELALTARKIAELEKELEQTPSQRVIVVEGARE